MLILFDHGTPKGLARSLAGHEVHTAQAKGWDTLANGALLKAAEDAGFDLLLTTDRRIRYQQNLTARRIALVVLTGTTKWSQVRRQAERILAAVNGARSGGYTEVEASWSEPTAAPVHAWFIRGLRRLRRVTGVVPPPLVGDQRRTSVGPIGPIGGRSGSG